MFIIYKRLRAVSREGKRDEGAKKVVDFYDGIIGKAKGFKGLIMTGSWTIHKRQLIYLYGNQDKIWITTMQMVRSTLH
jgi:hypothetical protein